MNLEGQFVPTWEPSFPDSLGKDNAAAATESPHGKFLICIAHLPRPWPPPRFAAPAFAFLPHPGVISPRSYRASAASSPARETVVLRLPEDSRRRRRRRRAGMPRSGENTAREPACWKLVARRSWGDLNYNSMHVYEASGRYHVTVQFYIICIVSQMEKKYFQLATPRPSIDLRLANAARTHSPFPSSLFLFYFKFRAHMHVCWAIIVALSHKALSTGENVRRASERGGGFERSGAQAILIITYYGWRWELGNSRGTSLPAIKRPEQPGTRALAISPISPGRTRRRSHSRAAHGLPLLHLIRLYLIRPHFSERWKAAYSGG